jgi:hypothetical protein
MNIVKFRKQLLATLAVALCGLGLALAPHARAEVNQAVRIDSWSLVPPSKCENYRLTQLWSYVSCINYQIKANVVVRNLRPEATGGALWVSLQTDKNTLCGSVQIYNDIPAGGTRTVEVTCTTRSKNGSSSVPTTLKPFVHQHQNLSNSVTAAAKNAPWCGSFTDFTYGTCGSY